MATIVASPPDRKASERKFYSRMALFLVFVVLLGFGPSFYLRGIVPPYPRPNPTLPPGVILHGAVFTAWMGIFVAQTQLITARQHKIHMRLGIAWMLFAIAMIPVMYLTAMWQVARANQPPFTDPLNWTIVPLASIPAYGFMVWTGWKRRREAHWNKRAMLCSALMMMDPAIGRLPIAPPTLGGFTFLFALSLATFIPLFLWDRRTLGRIHPATKLGFGLAATATAIRLIFLATGAWAPIAAQLPGV
jgi:hypothetical protein